MSSKTKIEWTDMTSNPIHLVKEDGKNGGHWCKKISEGCANCYAEAQNQSGFFSFASHLKYAGEAPKNLILDEAVLQSWVKLKKPHKIFVCSMTDMFGEWVSKEWILKIFTYFRKCPQHTFQVLTKRPERMHDIISKIWWKDEQALLWGEPSTAKPLPNVWLGTSIENQKALYSRFNSLRELRSHGWTTFYSVEPLLEKVNLDLQNYGVGWVIVGGESGKGARPCNYEWVLGIVEQCQKTGTPVFVKQLGSNPGGICTKSASNIFASHFIKDSKGGDIQEFPLPIQVREFPKTLATTGSK